MTVQDVTESDIWRATEAAWNATRDTVEAVNLVSERFKRERVSAASLRETNEHIHRVTITAVAQETYWDVWLVTRNSISIALGVRWLN